MPSLREHLNRTPEVRSRNLAAWMAPALGERATPLPDRFFEEAALTVLGHGGAERLLKHGDMLFDAGGTLTRLQGYKV